MKKYAILFLGVLMAFSVGSVKAQGTTGADIVLIGDTTNMVLNGRVPYQSFSSSYTQQLVLSSELNGAAMITGIDLYCGNTGYVGRQTTIYMANTYMTLLDSLVPFGATFQQVAVDSFVCTSGWYHIEFATPFHYNGFGNLVVAFDSPLYMGMGGADFYCSYTQNVSRYSAITLDYLTSSSPTSAIVYRNIMRLHTQPVPAPATTCPAPTLRVHSLGDTEVGLTCGSGGSGLSWTAECIADGYAAWYSNGYGTSDTTFVMTGLRPHTHYTFRVTSFCADTSTTVLKHILTNCPSDTVPFSEDFETTLWWPDCWSRTAGSAGDLPSMSGPGHSSSRSLQLKGGTVVLQPFGVPADSLELSFWVRNGSGNATLSLYVGVVTDPLDLTTFVPVDTIVVPRNPTWNSVVMRLDNYPGIEGRIAFMTANPMMTYLYIDDLDVRRVVPCQTITTVSVDHVTDTAALVHWVDSTAMLSGADSVAVEYEVAYGPAGFTIDSAHTVTHIQADSLSLQGLLPYTVYEVYVRSACVGAYTNWSPVTSFRTLCSLQDTLPFFENFDSYSGYPKPNSLPCWDGHVEANTCVVTLDANSHSGTRALRWDWSSYDATIQTAVLPAINTAVLPLNTLQLSFWAKNEENIYNRYGEGRLVVGVMSDPEVDSTFVPIDTLNIVGDNWYRYDVPLIGITGTVGYVAIRSCQGIDGRDGWRAYIDDLELNLMPPCPNVTGVTLTALTSTTATVQWDNQANAVWQVYIDTLATATPEADTSRLTVPEYTFSDLSTGTPYYVWVRSVCTLKNDTSGWEGPLQVVPGVWNMRANKNDALAMCGVALYDNGGASAPFTTQHSFLVIHPDMPGHLVTISGMCNIGTAASFTIYDGVGTSGGILWTKTYNNGQYAVNFGPVISETGSITLEFEAFFIENREGFELQVSCIPDTCVVHHLQLDTTVAVTDSTLALSWECNGSSLYEVEYGPVGFTPGTGTHAITIDNSFVITGLSSLERREVHVRSLCAADDTSAWVRGIFTTEPCADAILRDNFDSTMAYEYIPSAPVGYNGYYSYVQTLIAPVRLSGLEQGITAFAFRPVDYTEGDHLNNVSVWLANVADTALNDGFILPDADHRFVKVVDSANFCHMATSEWQTIRLDRPFLWDGHSTLMVAVLCEDGGEGRRVEYSGHYNYSDFVNSISRTYLAVGYTPIDIDSARTYTQPYYNAYGSFVTGDIRLYSNICDESPCDRPEITSYAVNGDSVTVEWRGTGSAYQLSISPDRDSLGVVSVGGNSYTFSGLQPATHYRILLRQNCTAELLGYSAWASVEFTTASVEGIDDIASGASGITLYPNPATSLVTIGSHQPLVAVTLTDMMGRRHDLHFTPAGNFGGYTSTQSNNYTIDIAGHPQGAYFLILTTVTGQRHTMKLVKY